MFLALSYILKSSNIDYRVSLFNLPADFFKVIFTSTRHIMLVIILF